MSHNKKRNTAFLFEVLSKEGTVAIINKDIKRANFIKTVMLDFFNSNTEMKKELDLYKLLESDSIESEYAEKYLQEVKNRHARLDKKKIFNEQSTLIGVINKYLGGKVYNHFVPNYKTMATISQIFNSKIDIKEKILLEQTIIKDITTNQIKLDIKPIDNLVYKSFTNKFNEKYSSLLSEQKELLTKFVGSFADGGLELKIYLNEEIDRLKLNVENAFNIEEIKNDEDMYKKTESVKSFLENFKDAKEITNDMLQGILKIQQFVHEVNN